MDIILQHPVKTIAFSQGFGENPAIYRQFGQAGHNGLDYIVPLGTFVMAAAAGLVVRALEGNEGYGNYIQVDHGDFETLYCHLSKLLVKPNDLVEAGENIGLSGSTGFSTGPHLHFELRLNDQLIEGVRAREAGYPQGAVDPSPYFVARIADPGNQSVAVVGRKRAAGLKSPAKTSPRALAPGDVAQVSATAGVNLRQTPDYDGPLCGVGKFGDSFEVVSSKGEWIGIKVFARKSYFRLIQKKE